MWISRETVARAKEMDALTWLSIHEPWNLVRIKGGYYTTKEHDSLKIDHGKWCWWSHGIGGRSALDYLIKVKGLSFTDAVCAVLSIQPDDIKPDGADRMAGHDMRSGVQEENGLKLPEPDSNNDILIRYLTGRGIDGDIIRHFTASGDMYQEKAHKNVVFIGRDYNRNVRLASMRGTRGRFHNTVP
ncbi:MAG: DUF3991 domain-containing protein, partial [Wujia sp.]